MINDTAINDAYFPTTYLKYFFFIGLPLLIKSKPLIGQKVLTAQTCRHELLDPE